MGYRSPALPATLATETQLVQDLYSSRKFNLPREKLLRRIMLELRSGERPNWHEIKAKLVELVAEA